MFKQFYRIVALTLFIFSLFFQTHFAQAPDTMWTKKIGGSNDEIGSCIQQTTDGGYIVAGHTQSFGVGLDDIWLIKTNAAGDTLWTRTYGGTEYDYCYYVQQTSDGGYLLIGETDSFDPTYWFAWIIKTNSFGDTLWTNVIGESRHYFARSGLEISGGGYLFTGRTKATGAGQEDLWLVKLDAGGDTVWTKTIGGGDDEQGISIQQTNDGGFIIAGVTKSFGAGDYDAWLIRSDPTGDTIWTKTFGGSSRDFAYDVQQTNDNGFIIAGMTESFGYANNFSDVWLIKTNSNGDTLWTKTFGGIDRDGAFALHQTSDGGYILVGFTDSFGAGNYDVWLIKTNSSGDSLWTSTYGGIFYDYGRSVEQTDDGGYIIAGDYYETITNSRDVWLIKISPDPNEVEHQDLNSIPETFSLKQNYPNPFNPITTIEFGVPSGDFIKLHIYNSLGEEVTLLVNEYLNAGNYKVKWDAEDLPVGIYIYKLSGNGFSKTKKMVLLK